MRARALEHAGLTARRGEDLWRGLRRRGYWPDVSLRFGFDHDRDRRRFADQAFVSGDFRNLFDRTNESAHGYSATVELDWSLGEIAYPDDSVDLSRELRQVVSLRDDISDEINQLYFERQRLRAQLARAQLVDPAAQEPGQIDALVFRAREIAAQLDAWTGGFFLQSRSMDTRILPRTPVPENDVRRME